MTNGPPEDARARVRSYLMAQGDKYNWLDLWPRVMGGRLELLEAMNGVSEVQAAFEPSEDDWSIAEVAHHALNSARSVAGVVERLARGEEPARGQPVDPERESPAASFEQLRQEFQRQSAEFAGFAATLPEQPSMEGTYAHAFFGDLHCRAWYLFQRVHDQDHAQQIEAVKAAPGYPGA